jgi:uncharacterized membrane protein
MAQVDIIMPQQRSEELPVVRDIFVSDLKDVLKKGLDDFWAMPTHVVFLTLIYPVAGIFLARAAFGYDFIPLLYPLAAGFALLGPIAAIGLYELSRRREQGLDTSWRHAFDILHSPSLTSIALLGLILLAIFMFWIAAAQAIYDGTFGRRPIESVGDFVRMVTQTPEGLTLVVAGNALGFVLALVAAAISVISFPLLLDRNVGFATAISTSLKVVAKNPLTMAVWGLIVAISLALGFLTLFVGLAFVVPVLGHATWHLYRRAVEPSKGPRPEFHAKPKGVRYGAEFPSSLFLPSRREKE